MIVGITGGIGSGKTTIAEHFKSLGVPVYHADDEAKALMLQDPIRSQLIGLFGDDVYKDSYLNKDLIRSSIFTDDSLRNRVNEIVHPQVAQHFKLWYTDQNAPYVLKEAAIIFEAGLTKQYDVIITVVADRLERLKRVLSRPGVTQTDIEAIMEKQWPDEEKIKHSDFVIYNNTLEEAYRQVKIIHSELLKKLETS